VYRSKNQDCEYITTDGVAVGIFKAAEYKQGSTTLHHGDIMVLYTDGITEVINNNQEEFGEDRLKEIIVQNANETCSTLITIIMQAINTFSEDQELFDDATLVIVKRMD